MSRRVKFPLAFLAAALLVAAIFRFSACGGSYSSGTAGMTSAPSITVQPMNQTVAAGQTATFSVTASGSAPLAYQWQMNDADISGANSASYTTPVTAAANSGERFRVKISNAYGSVTSTEATLTVNPGGNASSIDVVTYHYDNMRTGQNTHETILTPANVNVGSFGKLGEFVVDGLVDAQPLYLSNVAIPGKGTKNVLYVATEHGSVYAFDAESVNGSTGTFLWKTSTLASGQYFQRLHALDLATGAELFGGPTNIAATFPGTGAGSTNGSVTFDPKQYKERPGLLQVGSAIYTTWSSHCDFTPYTSWIMTYSADTLAQTGVLNLVPNGSDGAIWMAGAAPGADPAGDVFFILGNGTFDTTLDSNGFPSNGNCGNCFVRLTNNGGLKLADYFTPSNTVAESAVDKDFGSGGELLLPDLVDAAGATRHLAVGSGKDGIIYVVDRDNMGKFSAAGDKIYQEIAGKLAGGVFGKPSYFNNTVYYGAVGDALKAFPISMAKLAASPSSQSVHVFNYPGANPSISANGNAAGIVWALENNNGGILFAFDASNLANELYDSNQAAGGRDHFPNSLNNKLTSPMVANGRVYVQTPSSVAVFGLLH